MSTDFDTEPTQQATAEDQIAQDQLVETEAVERSDRRAAIARPAGVDQESRLIWEYIAPVTIFHLLIPLAFLPYFFSWWGVVWLLVGNYLFTSLGIGAGYHRLLTHRGFKCPRWFEYTLATLGICSLQDSPIRWVLVHRIHHQHSDHQPDPHTPRVSTFWSHMGWLFVENRELSTVAVYDRYVRDLLRDPYYLWLQRGLNWVWVYVIQAIAITAIGYIVGAVMYGTWNGSFRVGMQFLMWGVIMRTVFSWHVTWGINSFSHMWGYRNYETREDSRNNWLFALLTNGEGWHNNHHADPRSARHGHRWWEIDVTWISLILFERLGIVTGLARPNSSSLSRKTVTE